METGSDNVCINLFTGSCSRKWQMNLFKSEEEPSTARAKIGLKYDTNA